MKHFLTCILLAGTAAVLSQACGNPSFPTIGEGKRLSVTIVQGDTGTPDAPLPVNTVTPITFVIGVTAQLPDGTTDTSFNGYASIFVQPGTVLDLNVNNVPFVDGIAQYSGSPNIPIPVVAVFGPAHIWADDIGYVPVSASRTYPDGGADPPQCSDGIDNNHNGLIDYPADPGCYASIDDTEDFGSYASGASPTIYFDLPRIQLVRGYDPANGGEGNATAFPNAQVDVKTGWTSGLSYDFSTIVIGLTSAGFYVQDLQNDMANPPGYSGLYAYNFETPTDMRVCDRVQVLSGEASDFYGFTELNYPTWQLEYWDPTVRPCMVPEPTVLGVSDVLNENRMWQVEATLGRLLAVGTVSLQVAAHFGPEDAVNINGAWTFGPDQSNCDFDHNGKINYSDPNEGPCADACNGSSSGAPTDIQCSEYSQFASEDNFLLIQSDSSNPSVVARPQVNAASANLFDPLAWRGQPIKAFTGLISYFSGGTQFTFNARCDQDIVPGCPSPPQGPCTPGTPLTSDVACVNPRTVSELDQHSQ
jgi:hypothetical protein